MSATQKAAQSKVKSWANKNGTEKAVFCAKLAVMVCSFGYIFGGLLVEGMTYETYKVQ